MNCVLMAMIECLKLNVVTGFAWQRRLEIVSHCAGSRLYKVTTGYVHNLEESIHLLIT